ncbi:MAG: hypothetical protein LRY71_05275 [Bacillaceae bacterium]|nr:hypothetical protein [Bacillaceae bacterium]
MGVIDLNNIDELVESGEVTIEEISYEEFVEKVSESQGISKKQVMKEHPDLNRNLVKRNFKDSTNQIGTLSTGRYSMHEINIRQNVRYAYKPTVQIFVWTYNHGSFREFEYIQTVGLNRIYNGTSKGFAGTVEAKLTSKTKI